MNHLKLVEDTAFRLWFVFYWPDRDDMAHYRHLWEDCETRTHWVRVAREVLRIAAYNAAKREEAFDMKKDTPRLALPAGRWGGVRA